MVQLQIPAFSIVFQVGFKTKTPKNPCLRQEKLKKGSSGFLFESYQQTDTGYYW